MKISKREFETIKFTLKEIYSEFHPIGVQSVYLWGSVLSDEYLSNESDIDSIAIVKDNTLPKYEEEIRSRIKDFNINLLYLGELNGSKIHSRLAGNIHPKLLLLDFEGWKKVSGKKFLRVEFKIKEISFDEAIKISLEKINKVYFCKTGNPPDKYLIKSVIKICHYLNEKEKGRHLFTHRNLIKNCPKERKNIIQTLLLIKESNWSNESIERNLSEIKRFLNELR